MRPANRACLISFGHFRRLPPSKTAMLLSGFRHPEPHSSGVLPTYSKSLSNSSSAHSLTASASSSMSTRSPSSPPLSTMPGIGHLAEDGCAPIKTSHQGNLVLQFGQTGHDMIPSAPSAFDPLRPFAEANKRPIAPLRPYRSIGDHGALRYRYGLVRSYHLGPVGLFQALLQWAPTTIHPLRATTP